MRSIYVVCIDPLAGANGAYTYDGALGAYRSQSNSIFYIQKNNSTNDWELYSLSQYAPFESRNILYKLGGSLSEPISITSLGSTSWTTVNGAAPVPVTHAFTHTMCGSVTVNDVDGVANFLSGTYDLQTTLYGIPYYTKGTDLYIEYVTTGWFLFYNDPTTPGESRVLHELLGTFSINDPPVGQWAWVGGVITSSNSDFAGSQISYVSDECINCSYGYNGDPGGAPGGAPVNATAYLYTKDNIHYIRLANNQPYVRSGSTITNPVTSLEPDDPSINGNLTLWLDASQPVYDSSNAAVTPDLPCVSAPFSDVYKWPSRANASYTDGSQSFENNSQEGQPSLATDGGRRFLDFHSAYANCTIGGLLWQQNGDENTLLNYTGENSNGYTIFVVAKLKDINEAYQPIWSNFNADGIKIIYDGISNTITHSATNFFGEEVSLSYGPPNSWKVFTFYLSRTSSSQASLGIKINNTSSNSVVVDTASSSFLIGDSFISSEVTLGKETDYEFKGGLAEIITYNTSLSSNNVSQIISGLMTKWSIT